jgi:hypothetical protein
VIDSISACENYGAESSQVYLLLPELFGGDSFHTDKRVKMQFHIEFPGQIKIG